MNNESTEPSALAKAIHHGAEGYIRQDGLLCRRIEKTILETNIVIEKASLPEVVEHRVGGYYVAGIQEVNLRADAANARSRAAEWLALAEYIETAQAAESVAAEKLTKRRDELAREFFPYKDYSDLMPVSMHMVDRIIELESRA